MGNSCFGAYHAWLYFLMPYATGQMGSYPKNLLATVKRSQLQLAAMIRL
jgi:hypothetical protein